MASAAALDGAIYGSLDDLHTALTKAHSSDALTVVWRNAENSPLDEISTHSVETCTICRHRIANRIRRIHGR